MGQTTRLRRKMFPVNGLIKMPMQIDIKINGKPIYQIEVSNMGGNPNGDCLYEVAYTPIGCGRTVHKVMHDRRHGALTLAMKAINEIDHEEKRDD